MERSEGDLRATARICHLVTTKDICNGTTEDQDAELHFRSPSARRSQGRHRLQCPDTSRWIPVWSVQATTAQRGGSWCADRSASPWSFAWSASHSRHGRDPVRLPNDPESERTAECPNGVIHEAYWGNRKPSDFKAACLIQVCRASRVPPVISNWTGRCVLCCMTMARVAIWSPWHTSRTLSATKSQPRSLLPIPRLKSASSRIRPYS